jgi:hypothetical protein
MHISAVDRMGRLGHAGEPAAQVNLDLKRGQQSRTLEVNLRARRSFALRAIKPAECSGSA